MTHTPPRLDRVAYLEDWAARHFFGARYDLASSGVPFEGRVLQPGFDATRFQGQSAMATVDQARALVADMEGVQVERVVPALGASGGVFLCALALSSAARRGGVVVENPVYEPLRLSFSAFGAPVRPLERRADHGWRLEAELDRVAELARGAACVVVTNPHNPSGLYESNDVITRLAEAVAPAWLLVDEVYLPFIPGARTSFGCADNICVISSLTKAWGLGWLRFGWVVAPDGLLEQLRSAQFYTPGLFPAPTAAAAVDALERRDALYTAATAHLTGRNDAVAAALADHPVLEWQRPDGELVISTVNLRGIDDDLGFARDCLEQCEVALAPGSYFGAPGTLRLGTGALPDRFDEGLTRFVEFAAARAR